MVLLSWEIFFQWFVIDVFFFALSRSLATPRITLLFETLLMSFNGKAQPSKIRIPPKGKTNEKFYQKLELLYFWNKNKLPTKPEFCQKHPKATKKKLHVNPFQLELWFKKQPTKSRILLPSARKHVLQFCSNRMLNNISKQQTFLSFDGVLHKFTAFFKNNLGWRHSKSWHPIKNRVLERHFC